MRGNILVIDDEQEIFEQLQEALPAHHVHYASMVAGAKQQFVRKDIDLVFMDLNLRGEGGEASELAGLDYTRKVRERYPEVYITVLSNYADVYSIKTAMKNGADDYLHKGSANYFSEEFREYVNKIVRQQRMKMQAQAAFKRQLAGSFEPDAEDLEQIRRMAQEGGSCWIYGEPGIDLESAARRLHLESPHHAQSRPPELLDLRLHAPKDLLDMLRLKHGTKKDNIFRRAHHSMLIVTGAGEADPGVQQALWEIIQERQFLDSREPLQVQLVLLTHLQPVQAAAQGKLILALSQGLPQIRIKPLRERKAILNRIIDQFLEEQEYPASALGTPIRQLFAAYDYPMNFTELYTLLRQTLERHESAHPRAPKKIEIGWQSVPEALTGPTLELHHMKREVARVELSFIERALLKFEGERTQKTLAAAAVGAISADNLKKTYILKYADLYPDLIQQYPAIVKLYKL